MKKIIIGIIIGVIVLTGTLFLAVDYIMDETYNKNPCEASGNVMIEKLRSEYDLWTWASTPKNFCSKCSNFDSSIVDCKTITCMMGFHESKLEIFQDSTALIFANIFWSDPINVNVDTLYLELRNNNCYVEYCVSKDDLSKKAKNVPIINFNKTPKYEIISENYGISHSGYFKAKTFNLNVLILKDFGNIDSLSHLIKDKYYQSLNKEKVDELSINIKIGDPLCKLCTSKKYKYFFELTTKRVEAYKKNKTNTL